MPLNVATFSDDKGKDLQQVSGLIRLENYFRPWYLRSVVHIPVTLIDRAVEAIETASIAGWTARSAHSTRLGCMKLSVLPLTNSAFTCNPPMLIVAVGFERDPWFWTVASIGKRVAAETLPLETALPWQTLPSSLSSGIWHSHVPSRALRTRVFNVTSEITAGTGNFCCSSQYICFLLFDQVCRFRMNNSIDNGIWDCIWLRTFHSRL